VMKCKTEILVERANKRNSYIVQYPLLQYCQRSHADSQSYAVNTSFTVVTSQFRIVSQQQSG
jgi:hypothetical protein